MLSVFFALFSILAAVVEGVGVGEILLLLTKGVWGPILADIIQCEQPLVDSLQITSYIVAGVYCESCSLPPQNRPSNLGGSRNTF